MIGNSNYIGTILGGKIQEVKSKEKKTYPVSSKTFNIKKKLERLIGLAIN